MNKKTAVWPYDFFKTETPSARRDPTQLVCFLICPFKPKDLYDGLFNIINEVCKKIGTTIGCRIELKRVDKILGVGIIHSEIWREIQTADCIITDVSELNGNVMFELGAAAGYREKEQVIILKNSDFNENFLFDIIPARHIIYKLKSIFETDNVFLKELYFAITQALIPAPFRMDFKKVKVPNILEIDFTGGKDSDFLISPPTMHRKPTKEFLEFGSFYSFSNSWLMLASPDISKFKITAIMKFTEIKDKIGALIALSVRTPHYFANYGHTLFLNTNGKAINRTVPEDEKEKYHDEKIADYPDFNTDRYYKFYFEIDDKYFHMYIDDIGKKYEIATMPFVYPRGKILLQTFRTYAGLKYLKIEKYQ